MGFFLALGALWRTGACEALPVVGALHLKTQGPAVAMAGGVARVVPVAASGGPGLPSFE